MNFDTHPELIIQPYLNGIKLVKPENKSSLFPNIDSLFAMPLLVYFVTFDAAFVDANHLTHLTNIPGNQGYYSDMDLKGIPLSFLFQKNSADMMNKHNNLLQETKRLTIYEEYSSRLDDIPVTSLSFKFPVFDSQDKIIAVFGISTLTDNSFFKEAETLPVSLERIIQTGLISRSTSITPGFHINNTYFSKQEITCLRLLITGKTMKLIGRHMGISPRTVEHYLDNIKRKLHVKTKSELIEKVVQTIWPEMTVMY